MKLEMLKAKLHRIRVTESCLDYEGSLTLARQPRLLPERRGGAQGEGGRQAHRHVLRADVGGGGEGLDAEGEALWE